MFGILHRTWQPLCLNQLISYFDLDNKVITKELANESSRKHVQREENNTKAAGVDWEIYWKYFQSGKSVAHLITWAILLVVAELLFCLSDYWIKIWIESEKFTWMNNNSSNNTILPSMR